MMEYCCGKQSCVDKQTVSMNTFIRACRRASENIYLFSVLVSHELWPLKIRTVRACVCCVFVQVCMHE